MNNLRMLVFLNKLLKGTNIYFILNKYYAALNLNNF